MDRSPLAGRVARTVGLVASAVFLTAGAAHAAIGTRSPVVPGTLHLAQATVRPLFQVPALRPGETVRACAVVRSDGSLPARPRLFAAVTGSGLDRYLHVTVEAVAGPCRGLLALPGGSIFDGALAAFPRSAANGLELSRPVAAGTTVAYRFGVTLEPDQRAEGRTASVQFLWEATDV